MSSDPPRTTTTRTTTASTKSLSSRLVAKDAPPRTSSSCAFSHPQQRLQRQQHPNDDPFVAKRMTDFSSTASSTVSTTSIRPSSGAADEGYFSSKACSFTSNASSTTRGMSSGSSTTRGVFSGSSSTSKGGEFRCAYALDNRVAVESWSQEDSSLPKQHQQQQQQQQQQHEQLSSRRHQQSNNKAAYKVTISPSSTMSQNSITTQMPPPPPHTLHSSFSSSTSSSSSLTPSSFQVTSLHSLKTACEDIDNSDNAAIGIEELESRIQLTTIPSSHELSTSSDVVIRREFDDEDDDDFFEERCDSMMPDDFSRFAPNFGIDAKSDSCDVYKDERLDSGLCDSTTRSLINTATTESEKPIEKEVDYFQVDEDNDTPLHVAGNLGSQRGHLSPIPQNFSSFYCFIFYYVCVTTPIFKDFIF